MAAIELTADNFNSFMVDNDIVIVNFWAAWCGPCKRFAPVFEEMSEQHPDIIFGKVNTEEQQALATQFQIHSIPTLMIFREQMGVFAQPDALSPAAMEEVVGNVRELDMDHVRAEVVRQQEGRTGKRDSRR